MEHGNQPLLPTPTLLQECFRATFVGASREAFLSSASVAFLRSSTCLMFVPRDCFIYVRFFPRFGFGRRALSSNPSSGPILRKVKPPFQVLASVQDLFLCEFAEDRVASLHVPQRDVISLRTGPSTFFSRVLHPSWRLAGEVCVRCNCHQQTSNERSHSGNQSGRAHS